MVASLNSLQAILKERHLDPNQARGFRQELADPIKGKDAFKKYRNAAKRKLKKGKK